MIFNNRIILVLSFVVGAAGLWVLSQPKSKYSLSSDLMDERKIVSEKQENQIDSEFVRKPEATKNLDIEPSLPVEQEGNNDYENMTYAELELIAAKNESGHKRFKVLEQRNSERGYFRKDELLEYESYTQDALETLGLSGDLKAAHILTNIYMKNGKKDNAIHMLKIAATYGSTAALTNLISIYSPNLYKNDIKNNTYRDDIVNSKAYRVVAEMRGDYSGSIIDRVANKDNSINKKLDHLIKARAEMIYQDLSRQREKLGLPKFDNSTPAELIALFKDNTTE